MPEVSLEVAIRVAIHGLAFIAEDQNRTSAFLGKTGVQSGNVAELASDPEFLAGVLDYILGDEPLLLEFCQASGLDPAVPRAARNALPNPAPED